MYLKFLAVFLMMLPVALQAQQIKYKCIAVPPKRENIIKSNIPEAFQESYYFIDEEDKSAAAFDGIIYRFHKDPISVDFALLRSGKYRMRWKIQDVPMIKTSNLNMVGKRTASNETMRFKAWLHPESKKYTLRIYVGQARPEEVIGTCQEVR